jgi:hypothetical protein
MHSIKHIILTVLIIQFSVISIAFLNVKAKYPSRKAISVMNNYRNNNKVHTNLVLYNSTNLIWRTYNNPINKPIINECLLHKDLVDILNKLKSVINFRVVNCYVSSSNHQLIMSQLNKKFIELEYGKFSEVKEYLSIQRQSGKIVDIEILDINGNKLYRDNKYLNTSSSHNYVLKGLIKVTKYPWMWKIN